MQAGLGLTVRSTLGMPATLSPLTDVLPSPGTLGIALLRAGNEPNEAEHQLQALLTDAVHQASASKG